MLSLLRESIAGVAAGIKGRPYLDSGLATRMVKLGTARSLCNCMATAFPVGNPKSYDNIGGRHKKQIKFPEFFSKIKAGMKKNPKKRAYGPIDENKVFCGFDDYPKTFYGPVFTGDVEKRYLDYLDMLDWDSFHNHIVDYPRRRSENEKRLIFEKWASHKGRKYPSPDIQEMRFTSFKKGLSFIDESNSRHRCRLGLDSKHLDRRDAMVFVDKCDDDVFEFPRMDNTGCQKKLYFPLFFTKMKSQQQKINPHKKMLYGPVFTGEVEKRYLDYLEKLDWNSLHKHITDYPRRRSEKEKMLIFDKWAAHYGKEYLPEDYEFEDFEYDPNFNDSPYLHMELEFKDLAFDAFETRLEYIDNVNSKHKEGRTLGLHSDMDKTPKKYADDYEPEVDEERIRGHENSYHVEGFLIPYDSITPPLFCELTNVPDSLHYDSGFQVCFPL